jgi:hypothetical protein
VCKINIINFYVKKNHKSQKYVKQSYILSKYIQLKLKLNVKDIPEALQVVVADVGSDDVVTGTWQSEADGEYTELEVRVAEGEGRLCLWPR